MDRFRCVGVHGGRVLAARVRFRFVQIRADVASAACQAAAGECGTGGDNAQVVSG